MLGIRILSGAILAGVGGKAVADGLLATGSLRGYAISRPKKGEVVHDVIQFEKVSFRYPDEEKWILKDLSFSVQRVNE